MSDEIRLHLELQTERNLASGMDPDEARYAARRQFGGVEQVKERCREQRNLVWLAQLLRDVLFGVRRLRRNPWLAAAIVGSLALCIGASTAVFSMLSALVLRPLPFHEPAQIVEIYNSFPKVGFAKLASNLGQFDVFRREPALCSEVALWRLDYATLGDMSGPMRVAGAIATAGIFDVLGVQPRLGHFFSAANHEPGADRVVVLTESFWTAQFQGDPGVIGRTLLLGGESHEIVGVAPRLLEALDARVKLIRPLAWRPEDIVRSGGYSPQLYGRLASGVTLDQAPARVAAIDRRLYEAAPADVRRFFDRTGHELRIDELQAQRVAPVRNLFHLLHAGVLLVLLIGCVNVSNLLLARTIARRGELATRMALGASRGRIVQQLFIEGAVLTGLGATWGLLLAWATLGTANRFAMRLLPDALPFALNHGVLIYTASIAVAVSLAVALLPMVHALGPDLRLALQSQGRGGSQSRGLRMASNGLIVAQVTFALILLVAAGLLVRSFVRALSVTPGFDPTEVVAARIAVPTSREADVAQRLERALQAVPDITASLATTMPFETGMPLNAFALRDYDLPAGAAEPSVFYTGVSQSYRETLRIPLREGRWFEPRDAERRRAVVVDEDFARQYFPSSSAVGRHIAVGGAVPQKPEDWLEIVGVVGKVRHQGVEEKSGQPCLYHPLLQTPFYGEIDVLIRSSRPVAETVALLRAQLATIDPTIPVFQSGPFSEVIQASFSARRATMWLLSGFAGIAVLLAVMGLYSVLAHDVSQRTREIGIRSAVGATRGQLAAMVVRQAARKTLLGVGLGLAGAAGLSHLIESLLYDVRPTDPWVYASAAVGFLAVAALASWLPARWAARVDPVIALRCE